MSNLPHPFSFAPWLASFGWLVVPLHSPMGPGCSCGRPDCRSAGKHPRTPNGLKDASRDLATIDGWWKEWPDANVGVATGDGSKVIALDVDPRHGGDQSLQQHQDRYGALPPTPAVLTGGGGSHFFFTHPGTPLSNSSSKVGAGLDVKADGGLIVAPPSLHHSGRRYEWFEGRRLDQVPLSPVPMWLLNLMRQPKTSTPAQRRSERRELVKLGVGEGARNASIASLAGHLLRRNVDPIMVVDLLNAWNEARNNPPLSINEVSRTIESIAGIELARRRGGRHE